MRKALALSVVVASLAAPAAALAPVEALPGGASAAFEALGAFRLRHSIRRLEAVRAPAAAPAAAKRSRYTTLRGHVNLSGSAYVPQGQTVAWITVSGSTQLQDETGHYLDGLVWLSDNSTYFLSGNYVSGWARPYAYVSIYDNGRFLGTVRVDGSIMVSGWHNGGWVNLRGSGWVQGSGTIDEPEPPQAP